MTETETQKRERQQRMALYRVQGQTIWNEQLSSGKGGNLDGEKWEKGYTVDDFVRDHEAAYQYRIQEELR